MVAGPKGVADIVQQRADHIFLVAAVLQRPGGSLQTVLQPVDGIAAVVPAKQLHVLDKALGQPFHEAFHMIRNDAPVLSRGLRHRPEICLLFFHVRISTVVNECRRVCANTAALSVVQATVQSSK